MVVDVIVIALMGALGGIVRLSFESIGAIGTLAVNVLGAFALGFLGEFTKKKNVPAWVSNGIGAGFLGSVTTFSAFTSDAIRLAGAHPVVAGVYVIASVGGGLYMCCSGKQLASRIHRPSLQPPTRRPRGNEADHERTA